jgi:hypothetical protein
VGTVPTRTLLIHLGISNVNIDFFSYHIFYVFGSAVILLGISPLFFLLSNRLQFFPLAYAFQDAFTTSTIAAALDFSFL